MKKFFSLKAEKWFIGELTIRYNFLFFVKLLLFLLFLPFLLIHFIIKFLYEMIVKALKSLKRPTIWFFKKIAWVGMLLGVLALAFWKWLCSLFKSKPRHENNSPKKSTNKWWLLLLLLLLLLGVLFFWKSCGKEKIVSQPELSVMEVYENSFDKVIVGRAYLDGVQKEISSKSCPRILVGLKFINDKPIADYNFEGLTYNQAVKVVAEDWKPLIVDNINPSVKLSSQKMAVVTLAAMRMGKSGFLRSTFLKKINCGNLDEASDWLLLQNAKEQIMKTGDEPKQYFYMLQLLWNEEISIDELLNTPMFSYRGIPVNIMYDNSGKYVFDENIKQMLQDGHFDTPKEALEL